MRAVFLSCLLVLAGCAPLSLYYKPGVTVTEARDTRLSCETSALARAPVASQLRRNPPVYVPARRICNAAGNCWVRGGYWYPGAVQQVDVNARLRGELYDQCMRRAGYAPVSVPACPAAVADAAPPGATTRLPELTPSSCAIRNPDGSFLIVNRG